MDSGFVNQVRRFWGFFLAILRQDMFDHDRGQKSAISGRRLHWILNFW